MYGTSTTFSPSRAAPPVFAAISPPMPGTLSPFFPEDPLAPSVVLQLHSTCLSAAKPGGPEQETPPPH